MPTPAAAQDSDTTSESAAEEVSDPLVEALERQKKIAELKKKIAELKKEIAEAEKSELEAKLPDTETTGSDGSVTLNEGAGYFAELLAYHALAGAAEEVAAAVKAPGANGDELIVSSDLDLATRAHLWEILNTKLNDFEKVMNDLIQAYPTPSATPPSAPPISVRSLAGSLATVTASPRVFGGRASPTSAAPSSPSTSRISRAGSSVPAPSCSLQLSPSRRRTLRS